MNAPRFPNVTRRNLLLGTGALVVSFSLRNHAFAQEGELNVPAKPPEPVAPGPKLPGSLADTPSLDAWIRIDADSSVTVYTGKAELGQGTKTSLRQIAAEELEVPPASINLITADTAITPDEGFTAGSQTVQNSGTAIRNAAAQVREILIQQASSKLQVPADQLKAQNGRIVGPDGKSIGYGEVVMTDMLHVDAQPKSKLKSPDAMSILASRSRVCDIPAKVTGGPAYVQDMRLPGMLHARVVRPPSWFATLKDIDTASIKAMPGVVAVIHDGNFLAVAAEKEFQAVQAMRALTNLAEWEEKPRLPNEQDLPAVLQKSESEQGVVAEAGGDFTGGVTDIQRSVHAAISDACIDRTFVLRGSSRQWHDDSVDPYPGRLSGPQGYRANAWHAAGQGALHPYGRFRLLWTQWRRRCSRRRGIDCTCPSRPSCQSTVDARSGASLGALWSSNADQGQRITRCIRQDRQLEI